MCSLSPAQAAALCIFSRRKVEKIKASYTGQVKSFLIYRLSFDPFTREWNNSRLVATPVLSAPQILSGEVSLRG
jgi:uncharacterized OB-fold protein